MYSISYHVLTFANCRVISRNMRIASDMFKICLNRGIYWDILCKYTVTRIPNGITPSSDYSMSDIGRGSIIQAVLLLALCVLSYSVLPSFDCTLNLRSLVYSYYVL